MEYHSPSYREVIVDLSNQDKWNEIALNTGKAVWRMKSEV